MRFATIILAGLLTQGIRGGAAGRDDAARALEAGAYAQAEALAVAWSAEVEAVNPPDSLEVARALDLVVASAVANGKAADGATLARARRAVEIKERQLGPDAADLATSLHNLAGIHDRRGEFLIALPLHERGLSIRRANGPPDSPQTADSLDATARTLLSLNRRADAERAIERSLIIRLAHVADSPVALARTLEISGRAKRDAGHYQDAADDLDRALELWNRFAPNHPDKTGVLDGRGYVYFLQGDIPGSRRAWFEASALTDERLDAWHPDRARSARSLALAEFALGELAAARVLRESAVTIGERSMSTCDPEVAFQFNDLAISFQYDGDYAAAERMFNREVATMRSCLGPNHVNLATAVFNQFILAREMGSYAQAQQLGQRAVQLWTNALGPYHPFVALGLNDLADFLAFRGENVRAQELFARALRIRRRALGPNHPDVAWTLTGLARAKAEAGDPTTARTLVLQALAIFEKTPPRDPDYLPTALALRGTLDARMSDYLGARRSLEQSLAGRETNLGVAHPLVASTRADIAAIDLALSSYDEAFVGALKAEGSARDLLRFTVRYMPDRRAMEYASARPRGLDIALSVAVNHLPTAASAALDAVIQSRGIVLDELAARARSVSAAYPQIASVAEAAAIARRRFAALALHTLGGQASDSALLERARREKEETEEGLAAQDAVLQVERSHAHDGLAEVRGALPPNSALISFVRYDRTEYVTRANRMQRRVVPSYVVFISRPDHDDVQVAALGSAASLDTLITTWREEAGGRTITSGVPASEAERAYRAIGSRLRQRIWDPIAGHLVGASQVFIVPDGALNLVSFAALPTDTNKYLVETGPVVHYLSTERDLIPTTAAAGRGLLAVGGPAYDLQASAPARPAPRRSGCGPLGPLRFEDLPGSRAEVQDIARIWAGATAEAPSSAADSVTVLSGPTARKSAVVGASAGRRIVHLATHGFFLGSDCSPAPANTRSVGGLVPVAARAAVRTDSPLLLAGLAFAGANKRIDSRSGSDEGILTAEEVAGLNLQGTQWVVLSACDTGLGEIRAGEGVFGLRRAFQIAGARTVIMSLWSVEDQSTRDWMRALYEARLQRHLSTADAVHDASLRVLQSRRTAQQSTHPFFWAAFVAAGDWK